MKSDQLTARKVATAKKPGYYCDGGNLYLQVSKYGTRNWVFRFVLNGKAREMGLGSLSTFSLKEARERARQCRQLIAQDIDPIEARLQQRDDARSEKAARITFKEAAERYIAVHSRTWKNAKHKAQWPSTLKTYAYPTLGSRPIGAIDGAAITEALSPIWATKAETARRVKQRIEKVIQWVKDGTPLPLHRAGKRVKHHAALPFAELPAFMAELRQRDSISARALEFCVLTAGRTNEVLGAKWDEIDGDVWTVPAERMKGGKEHDVPLSKRALEILKALPRERGGYVFPGARAKAPLSNMAMLELLRGMNGNGLTVHGFRSTFRDWAGDKTHFAREVIEHALAHHIADKAEAAYRRGTAPEKRRKLMEAWASYCQLPAAEGKVVALHGARA